MNMGQKIPGNVESIVLKDPWTRHDKHEVERMEYFHSRAQLKSAEDASAKD